MNSQQLKKKITKIKKRKTRGDQFDGVQRKLINKIKNSIKGGSNKKGQMKVISKTNQKIIIKAKNLEQYIQVEYDLKFRKQFEEVYGLNKIDKETKQPTYQVIKTSYSLRTKKHKQSNLTDNINKTVGVMGLKNIGNTCYINSIIQLLSNLQPLCDYFIELFQLHELNRQNPLSSRGVISVALSNLLKVMWSSSSPSMWTKKGTPATVPDEFIKVVSYYNPQFGLRTQEDAQEFLMYILDMIHEDLNRVQYPPPQTQTKEYDGTNGNDHDLEVLASLSWKDYLQRSKSIIVDLMQGQVRNSIKCTTCGYSTYKFEPLMYLSVPVPNIDVAYPLQNCIKDFLKEELLSLDNKWYCNNCKVMVQCIKKIDLWKLPTILVIHLKRFQYLKAASKIQTEISIPIESLNLTNELPKQQKEKPIYELLGCVCHQGKISKGHYFTYAKNKENYKWYEFNDLQITEVNPKDIPGDQVYVLIYGKSTIPLVKRQTLSMPDNWPHMI